jgi:hypothetical protein
LSLFRKENVTFQEQAAENLLRISWLGTLGLPMPLDTALRLEY